MNLTKLILIAVIGAPVGFGIGAGIGWVLHVSPLLCGAVGAAVVALLSLPGGSAASEGGDVEPRNKVPLFVRDLGDDTQVSRDHWLDRK